MIRRLLGRCLLVGLLANAGLPCGVGLCEEPPDTPAYRWPLEEQRLSPGEWLIRVSTLGTAFEPEHELEISSRGTIRVHQVKRLPVPSPLRPDATRDEIVRAVNANTVLEFSGPISAADRADAYHAMLAIAREFEALSPPRDVSDAARQMVVITSTARMQIRFDVNELDRHSKTFHDHFEDLQAAANRSLPKQHHFGLRPFRPLNR